MAEKKARSFFAGIKRPHLRNGERHRMTQSKNDDVTRVPRQRSTLNSGQCCTKYCGPQARHLATGWSFRVNSLLSYFWHSTGRVAGRLRRKGFPGRASAQHLLQAVQVGVEPLLENRILILRIHEPRRETAKLEE